MVLKLTAVSETAVVRRVVAGPTATMAAQLALLPSRLAATFVSPRLVHQPEAGQRHARETEPEFLQRSTAGNGLGDAPG